MLTRRRQVFVAPLMWIFHSQVYTNTYAFMAITEALSAVGGKSLFLAFVEIKGHHHLLKQKKEEMNLLFFPYCCHKHTYVCTYIQGNVNKDVAYESGSVRCWEQTGLLLSFENNASKASSIFSYYWSPGLLWFNWYSKNEILFALC